MVDVSPVSYAGRSEFVGYIEAMQALDLDALEHRRDADAALTDAVPSRTVRSFLLQNLRRGDDGGWSWQPNLEVLGRDIDELGGWPEEQLSDVAPYDGPTLWIAGERSEYVREDYAAPMERWFPRVRKVTIKDAGHWVHS